MVRLFAVGASGPQGMATYWLVLVDPRYLRSLLATVSCRPR